MKLSYELHTGCLRRGGKREGRRKKEGKRTNKRGTDAPGGIRSFILKSIITFKPAVLTARPNLPHNKLPFKKKERMCGLNVDR